MLGISIACVLYVLGTTVVLGVVPRDQLASSAAPFADAARLMWGAWAAVIVSIAIVISSIGALNGWTLLMGQVPMAASEDGLFPTVFARRSRRGVPAVGIVISATLATALLLASVAGGGGFVKVYDLIVSLSTLAAVIPYAFCSLAGTLIALQQGTTARITPVEAVAFVFSMFVLYGCGAEAVLYGLIMLLLGLPVYVLQRREHHASRLAEKVTAEAVGSGAR
jgi:arginine:agmatine antiporter